MRPRDLPDKTCERCGGTFNRTRQPSGSLESTSRYQRRRFCSRHCADEVRRAKHPRALVNGIVADWKAGMSRPAIARKHGVSLAMVAYRTEGVPRAVKRETVGATVRVECADCGDPHDVTQDALRRRERLELGPWVCRLCVNARMRTLERGTSTEWMRPEEQEDPHEWAARVADSMTRHECLLYCVVVDKGRLLDVDDSRAARGPKPRREQFRFEPHPYAPIGAAA